MKAFRTLLQMDFLLNIVKKSEEMAKRIDYGQ